MAALSGQAIATLVVFMISIIFVIYPVSFCVPLPYFGRKRVNVNLTTAPIIAILVLWAAQCLGPSVIRDGIVGTDNVKPYNILILFFSLAYMAITLDITGVLQAAAFWVSNKGGSNGYKLFLYFYIMLTVLSVVLGNDPVILSGTAFLVYYTQVSDLDPIPWLISEFAAANTASMVLFVGNPTNVVICEGFRINNAAFTAYTILPFLACIVFCFVALALQFHFHRTDGKPCVPRRLNVSGDLDVRSVLRDPIGAWVGSILLGSCLITIIVVSFVHVDVWVISLPFAVAKFLYDLGWDHYRSVKGLLPVRKGEGDDSAKGEEDMMLKQLRRHVAPQPHDSDGSGEEGQVHEKAPIEEAIRHPEVSSGASPNQTRVNTRVNTTDSARTYVEEDFIDAQKRASPEMLKIEEEPEEEQPAKQPPGPPPSLLQKAKHFYSTRFGSHFPTLYTAIPRLPFALVPFAFSQFILIEALAHQGWIQIFSRWLLLATHQGEIYSTVWLVGVLGVVLCNLSGTNIGATILLTKIVRAAHLSDASTRAAAVALAVASNIGAVSFTFSASLAGLLWDQILRQKGIRVGQRRFARWNMAPLVVMTGVGLGVVCAEMAVLYPGVGKGGQQ